MAKKNILNILVIIVLCFMGGIVYSNSFYGPFYFDDIPSIVNNPAIRNINNIKNIWNFWPTRFITYLSIAFNYQIGGLNTFGYHVFNLIIHLFSTILLWWLVTLTFRMPLIKKEPISFYAKPIAFFISVIFLLHPIQTQPVNYIVQRAVLLTAMLYLLSLSLYAKLRLEIENNPVPGAWKIYYIGSLIAAIMSMFSKEMAITLPVTICLYEFCFLGNKKNSKWKYLIVFMAVILIIPLVMLVTKSVDFSGMRRMVEDGPNISSWQYFLTQLRVLVTYIGLLFMPVNQNLDYDYPIMKSIFELPVILSSLLLFLILAAAIKLFRDKRLISFGIFWFFITLLPESSFIPIKDVIFEHRLYLPIIGFSIVLVSGPYYLFGGKGAKLIFILFSLLIVCYSAMSYQRNKVWQDELTLWEDTVHKSPGKARPYINRGTAYQKKNNFARAIFDCTKAIEIDPNYADAYYNRGNTFLKKSKYDEAILDYDKTIKIEPNNAKAYNNRGLAYFSKGNYAQAISDCSKAIEINPNYVDAYFKRGNAYLKEGSYDKAIFDYNEAIGIDPNNANAYYNRSIAYNFKGDYKQSSADKDKALELKVDIK